MHVCAYIAHALNAQYTCICMHACMYACKNLHMYCIRSLNNSRYPGGCAGPQLHAAASTSPESPPVTLRDMVQKYTHQTSDAVANASIRSSSKFGLSNATSACSGEVIPGGFLVSVEFDSVRCWPQRSSAIVCTPPKDSVDCISSWSRGLFVPSAFKSTLSSESTSCLCERFFWFFISAVAYPWLFEPSPLLKESSCPCIVSLWILVVSWTLVSSTRSPLRSMSDHRTDLGPWEGAIALNVTFTNENFKACHHLGCFLPAVSGGKEHAMGLDSDSNSSTLLSNVCAEDTGFF